MSKSNSLPPVIKWSGSKRSQAVKIVKYFPAYDTYYEPFIGGGSVMAMTGASKAVCGDICSPLVQFWNLVKTNPGKVSDEYRKRWKNLQKKGQDEYYRIRGRFNRKQSPFDLLFLSRTGVNGLIRFNNKGEFNCSFHHTRRGINPDRFEGIVMAWNKVIKNYKFHIGDYRVICRNVGEKDFVYFDPPYMNTSGMYYGQIDYGEFFEFLGELGAKGVRFALSFGTDVGKVRVPRDLYMRKIMVYSGQSSFRNVMHDEHKVIREALYLYY